jgi:ADP-heptose:LPS heptosyltransferase
LGSIHGLRHRLAPPGSQHARWLQRAYVPLFAWLRRSARALRPAHARLEVLTGGSAPPAAAPRVIVLKLDHLGDFVVSWPAMRRLRQRLPDADLTLVCGSWNRDWAEALGLWNRVVTFDGLRRGATPWWQAMPELLSGFAALDLPPADLAIDLRADPDTRRLLRHITARLRIGFAAPGVDVALDASLPPLALPMGEALCLLADLAADTLRPEPHPAATLAGWAPGPRRLAALAPGAGLAIKAWPVARLRRVGEALLARGLDLVIVGGAAEQAAAAALAAGLPAERVHLAIGTPLADLPALLGGLALFVGMDTGVTHLAAAIGVPTVSLLSGVPDGDVWRATGPRVRVLRGRTACSPCDLADARLCPHGVACLEVIGVSDVIASCEALLNEAAGA